MNENNEKLIDLAEHNRIWKEKPLLRKVYREFYKLIKQNLVLDGVGSIVELGSGIGKIKEIIPECICTDQCDNSYIDYAENAYNLTFEDESVSNLILFDVFHHLKYPGDAFNEFHRVLNSSGRVIIFEPYLSILGFIVYGIFHSEPLNITNKIQWNSHSQSNTFEQSYYAAQGNATRIFCWGKSAKVNSLWKIKKNIKVPAISYVASGGYSGKQLYPLRSLSFMQRIDRLCAYFPIIFATRMLVVLQKR